MVSTSVHERIESAVKNQLNTIVYELKNKHMTEALEAFDKELRQALLHVAIEYGRFFSVHAQGNDIVIHVKVDDPAEAKR